MNFFEKIFGKSVESEPKPPVQDYAELKKESSPTEPTDVEKTIETREKKKSTRLGGGMNESFVVELKDDGSVVFKPKHGEESAERFVEAGTYYKRERAAYLVNRFLNFYLVPPTVIREIDGEIGSAQKFISSAENFFDAKYFFAAKLLENNPAMDIRDIINADEAFYDYFSTPLKFLAIFDYLIWNSDRRGPNLLMKNERLYAIDNGLSFAPDSIKQIYKVDNFNDRSIPLDLTEIFKQSDAHGSNMDILADLLRELLPEVEVSAFFARLDFAKGVILNNKTLPRGINWDFCPEPYTPKNNS